MATEIKSARDALEIISAWAEVNLRDHGDWRLHNRLCNMLKAALSEPSRNCDVGTAREQHVRFTNYCNAHGDCVDCPIKAEWHKALSCGILWGQKPYGAEEGGAK